MASKPYLCWQKRFGGGWWPGSEGESGRFERRSGHRGRRASGVRSEPISITIHEPCRRPNMRPVARVLAEVRRQSNPCSPNVCISPCGATGAHRAAMWASPALANSKPSSDALFI